jgi:putative photosynthetic complex assembly protein
MTGLQRGLMALVVGVPLVAAIAVVLANPYPLYRANPGGIATPPNPSMAYPDLSLEDGAERLRIAFSRRPQDSLLVIDATTGETLRRYGAMEGGFVRGVLRPLDHERKRHGVAQDLPYEVVRETGGRLTLRDEASNVEIDVAAFGPTSYQLFSSLLDGSESPDVPALITKPVSMEDRP